MIAKIFNGITAYLGALGLINKLRLWKYFAIPILISVLTGVCFASLAYFLSDDIGDFISRIWVWDWGSSVFNTISTYLGGFLVIVLGLILYKHIVMALSAPFMSPVSEKIENYLLGDHDKSHLHRQTTFSQQLARGIRINGRNLFRELLLMIPLLLLSFIPVIGIAATVLIFLIQAYYIGFGNMDYTMERHFNYTDSIQFVSKNKGIAIGNGLVFIVILFLPVVGFIITLPLSVVAATTQTVKSLETKRTLDSQTHS